MKEYNETSNFAILLDGKVIQIKGEFELNEAQAHHCYDFLQGGKFEDFLPEEAKKIEGLLEDLQSY